MGARFEKDTKKATFDWLLKKKYITKEGVCNLHIDNLRVIATDKKNIELRFALDRLEYNVIYNPTKKDVKKAIHLFGTSVISKL